jgi:hypothetical protein
MIRSLTFPQDQESSHLYHFTHFVNKWPSNRRIKFEARRFIVRKQLILWNSVFSECSWRPVKVDLSESAPWREIPLNGWRLGHFSIVFRLVSRIIVLKNRGTNTEFEMPQKPEEPITTQKQTSESYKLQNVSVWKRKSRQRLTEILRRNGND